MARQIPAGSIPLTVVESRRADPYRLFVLSSLALGGLAGFLLGIHVPLGRLLGFQGTRTGELIQAHGQVQLLGFAGLFVMGMSLRLMPRFAHSRLQLDGLVVPMWALIVGSLVVRAVAAPLLPDGWHAGLTIALEFALLVAASCYLLIVYGTLLLEDQELDGTGWFFLVGASFFFLQAAMRTFVAIDDARDGVRLVPSVADTAILYLQLTGFLMAFIGGVGTRSIPTMTGRVRPDSESKRAAAGLAFSVLFLAAPLLAYEYVADYGAFIRLSDIGLVGTGLSLLMIVWLTGIFAPVRDRIRPASQPHMRLVKIAMGWLAFGGVFAVYLGAEGFVKGEMPSVGHLDALRHSLAAGAIFTLMLGMGLMILPEFAQQRMSPSGQRRLSDFFVVALPLAALLRVIPGLAVDWLSFDVRNGMQATAGTVAEIVVIVFAYNLVRLVRRSS